MLPPSLLPLVLFVDRIIMLPDMDITEVVHKGMNAIIVVVALQPLKRLART